MSEPGERTSLVAQVAEELHPFALPAGPLPDPTPAEGPDPYGNPDPEPEWLRIDWREHLADVEVANVPGAEPMEGREGPTRVNLVDVGSGSPALLLVHGLSGSWQNWLETIPHFSPSNRVVAIDLPGFGSSPLPPWRISIESYGRLLPALCETLGVEDCFVVGNSMGGFIAAEAVIRTPERFAKLVLVSAAGISHARLRRQPAETAARMTAATAPLWLRAQERALLRPGLRDLAFRNLFWDPGRLRLELIWEQFHHGAGKDGFLPAVQGLVGYDFLDRLEDVEVPTLIVWGRNDHVVPPQDAAEYGRRLRNSETVIFNETGHLPQIERPVRFNRLLEAFLSR